MDKTPIRPQTHITGDVGQTAVALIFKEWGWTADFVASDYGEDLDCNVYVNHRRTNLHLRCQVKSLVNAGESIKQLDSGDFSISVSTSTCKAWILSYFPVLLVVYDNKTKQAFWADATEQIRSRIEKLAQDTLTIHVSKHAVLEQSQSKIIDTVQSFYVRLLRLSSPALACHIYPVLMSGYRALPFRQLLDMKMPDPLPSKLSLHSASQDKDHLPAWAVAIKTLDQHFISGWEVEAEVNDINIFTESLREVLSNFVIPVAADEWISFVCSPIKFNARDDVGEQGSFWNRELTGWWNYTLIQSTIVSDEDYAFAPPDGFLRQIARRARSWEYYHHVDPRRDIAIQLFAHVSTTPDYKSDTASIRQHALGQFFPWTCPIGDTERLNKLLYPLELVFRKVDVQSKNEGYDVGVICTPLFEPGLGLFSLSQSWSEFQRGRVQEKLESSGLIKKIPGQPGSQEVTDVILNMFGARLGDPQDSFFITERDYIPGLPLDLKQRQIVVQRFRKLNEIDGELTNQVLSECKNNILRLQSPPQNIEVAFDHYEAWPAEHIAELSVSWQPLLEESSVQSFERLAPLILHAFDRLLPLNPGEQEDFSTTHDVLRYVGELYFEGDEDALYWNRKYQKSQS